MSLILNRVANYQHSRISTYATKYKNLVGVLQLNSGESLERNFHTISNMVEQCVERGAKLVCLPDRFAYQPSHLGATWSENINTGKWFAKYKQLALENQVWLSLGGFPETHETDPDYYYSSHFIINSEGQIVSKYRKMHLYIANLVNQGGQNISEDKFMMQGT